MKCPTCGNDLIQKPRLRLVTVGIAMIAAGCVAFLVRWFWIPGVLLMLAGLYLIAWATIGGGRWCRNCKQFIMAPKE